MIMKNFIFMIVGLSAIYMSSCNNHITPDNEDLYDSSFVSQLITPENNADYCYRLEIVSDYISQDSLNWEIDNGPTGKGPFSAGSPLRLWFKNGKLLISGLNISFPHDCNFVSEWKRYYDSTDFNLFITMDIIQNGKYIISKNNRFEFKSLNKDGGIYKFCHSFNCYRYAHVPDFSDNYYHWTIYNLIPIESPDINNQKIKIFNSYDEMCKFMLNELLQKYGDTFPNGADIMEAYYYFRDTDIDFDL